MDYDVMADEFLRNMCNFSRLQRGLFNESLRGEKFTLTYIAEAGGEAQPSEISRELNISSARIAATLNSLEKKGLITRKINKSDRRQIIVELTEPGERQAANIMEYRLNMCMSVLKLLGDQDAQSFMHIIERLTEIAPKLAEMAEIAELKCVLGDEDEGGEDIL